MHAALLANSAWLDDELTMFQQLTVGLVDEQVRLTRVLPAGVAGAASGGELGMGESSLLGKRMTWNESRFAAANHRRLVKLCDALDAGEVDLLHALHGDLWQPAMVIGDQLDLPVVFTANSSDDLRQATKMVRQINPTRCLFVATTEPIAAELRERTQNLVRIETVVPGVHVGDPALHPDVTGGDVPPCVAVCGDGEMDDAYQVFLEGMRLVVDDQPEMQFFFDGQLTDQRHLWRAVKKLDLLGNASFVPRRRGHRELLLMADAVVHPQTLGRARGVTLLAMAHAVPVLAAADELLDYLVPDQTAWVVDEPDAEAWAELLLRRVRDPAAAADLGMRSRAWVHEERLASDQIARVLSLYRGLVGEPLPFAG